MRNLRTIVLHTALAIALAISLSLPGSGYARDAGPLIDRANAAVGYVAHANARRHEWTSVVRVLDAYNWEHGTDPGAMALYMKALVETGGGLPARLFRESVPKSVQQHARGLYSLSSGHFRDARKTFADLSADEAGGVLGWTGLAFYAETAGNPQLMREALSEIRGREHLVGSALARELRMSLGEIRGDAEEIEQLIKEDQMAPEAEKLERSVILRYRINAALYQDRFAEAEHLLGQYVGLFGQDEASILLRSSLILLTQGPTAELRYIERKMKELPRMPSLRARFALANLDAGSPSVGVRIIDGLVQQRPFDFSLWLVFSDMVDVFDSGERSLDSMRRWFLEMQDAPVLTARLALAEYFSARNRGRGLSLLNLAESQFPLSREVLFARHTIALDNGDPVAARQWIERYVAAYPREVGARLLLMDLLRQAGDLTGARTIAKGLQGTKRWISKENRKRIAMLASQRKGQR